MSPTAGTRAAGPSKWCPSSATSPRQPESAVRQNPRADAAPVFAALGDETRLGLVARLSTEGPLSIAQLTQGGQVTRQAVTKHLHVLANAGVARSRLRGRERIWELEPEALVEARAYLERVSAQWDVVLARLQQFVEREESEAGSKSSERSGDHEHQGRDDCHNRSRPERGP